MAFSFKNLVIVAAVGFFASVGQADKLRIEINLNNLAATFSSQDAKGQYGSATATGECSMKLKVRSKDGNVDQEAACPKGTGELSNTSLVVKKANSKSIEVVLTSEDAEGKVSVDTIRGKFVKSGVQDGVSAAVYKMDLGDVRKKFAMRFSDQSVSLKVAVKIQGEGEIVVIDSGSEVRVQFPTIVVIVEGTAN